MTVGERLEKIEALSLLIAWVRGYSRRVANRSGAALFRPSRK
jgi:hypothetical protein